MRARRARPMLGTFLEISLDADSQLIADNAIRAGFDEAARLEALLSYFSEDSEISRLNKSAYSSPQVVSDDVEELLRFCVELSALSNSFNIVRSNHTAQPQNEKLDANILQIENHTVSFKHDVKIDLGGVAKGYIVDKAARVILSHPVANLVVNAGGDLKIARSAGLPINIRDPREPTRCATSFTLAEGAVATSAPYFSAEEHFMNEDYEAASSGNEFDKKLRSISIIAESCVVSDALTKVAALSPAQCPAILQRYGATAIILSVGSGSTLHMERIE